MTAPRSGPDSVIGSRLCRLRTERGLTQDQMAGGRYTRQYISAVETGQRIPTPQAIAYFAEQLGMDADDLRHGRPPGVASGLATSLRAARARLSQGSLDEAVETFDEIENSAETWSLTELQARARYCKGEAELHAGSMSSAADHYLRAEKILAEADPAARAYIVARRGYCLVAAGESSAAVQLLEHTLSEVGADAVDARVRLLTAVAHPYFELGAPIRAGAAIDEAMELADRVSEIEWLARLQVTNGRVQHARGDPGAAEAALDTAQRIFISLGFDAEAARCRWSLGYVLTRAGELTRAISELRAAHAVLEATGARAEAGGAALELAAALDRAGQLAEAEVLAEEAAELSARSGHVDWLAEAERLRGRIALARGDAARAADALRRALVLYEQSGSAVEVAVTARSLGRLLVDDGDVDAGLDVYRRGLPGPALT